jgi:hypothetical protein
MQQLDHLSARFSHLLEGSYDCPDRIVLNGFYSLGFSPGGFRLWWRKLHGDDKNLDNTHLMRMAGRFSRRLRAWAKANSIPVIFCRQGSRKHLLAEPYIPKNPNYSGVFLILVGRAPAPLWHVQRSEQGHIVNIKRKSNQSFVNHFSFHIMDPDWGHITIKMCSHPPFATQIILNGHEYVARQAKKKGIAFEKEGNCFTSASSATDLERIAETLRSKGAIGRLNRVCDRWIYTACLYFALSIEEQKQTGFVFSYSVYQLEYSRNLLFERGSELECTFQNIIDRSRSLLQVSTLKTIFGYKRRPCHNNRGRKSRIEVVLGRPRYDLTVFKVRLGLLALKVYSKGARVLRIEATVDNARALKCPRTLGNFPDIVNSLRGMVYRFLQVLRCIDYPSINHRLWDQLPLPGQLKKRRVAGIDISKPRIRAVIEAVIALAALPHGFTVRQLAAKVREITGYSIDQYKPWNAAYDLAKLRSKNIVLKQPNSQRYHTSSEGLRAIAALLVIVNDVIRPVLAGAGKPLIGRPPKKINPTDLRYRAVQTEMRALFDTLGIAA